MNKIDMSKYDPSKFDPKRITWFRLSDGREIFSVSHTLAWAFGVGVVLGWAGMGIYLLLR